MMRKFNKKKGSRRGAILVTVVFILAFAVIFIAAAMMLTQATRKRVYTEAESNQARLTVTSVAESWYRAIQKCEFEDDDLLALCKANSGTGTTIRIKASSTADTIPGLETEGGPSSTDSYTTMRLYRSPNVGGATKDEEFTYYADFSTHIDGQVENVRAALTYTPPVHNYDGAPFSTQVDLNGKFANNNLEVVGQGKDPDNLDNIFLVRKGGNSTDASFSSYATMIYCDGTVTFKDEVFYSKDIVFLSGAKLKSGDSGHFSSSSNVKNFFFFGDNNEPIATGSKGNFSGNGFNFYLCNRSNVSDWTSGGNVVAINADGTRVDGQAVSDAFKKKVQTYASYNASYKANGKEKFPTTDTFLTSAAKKLKIGKTATSSANADSSPKTMSLKKFLEDYHYQHSSDYVPAGAYYFTSDGSDHSENHSGLSAKEPYVMVLKGGSNYRFWFKGGVTFGLYNVIFIVDKPDKAAPVLFLLEDQANVNWPGDASGTSTNGKTGGNGILAVEGRNFNSKQAAYDFVKGITANTARQFENSNNKYSTRYNGENEPCAMVLGMGRNKFSIDKNIIMEAFIGLFNDSYNDDGSPKSTLSFRNNDAGVLYGRIMTDGLGFSNDSGSILYPASPAASTLPAPNPDMEKVVTCFSLKSMIYYYGLGGNQQNP